MYTPKFNYEPLSRQNINGRRLYATPDGQNLPSVTTILDATKSQETVEALRQWRKRVGVERATQITTEAANRGTKMHTVLEHWIKDGVKPQLPSNPFHHASWHMADVVISNGLANCSEFWGLEVPLYFPSVYAGTTDCVGMHGNTPSIIDFKQSNRVKKREHIGDYFLQLCAYAEAHNQLWATNINRGVIMMCVKPQLNEQLTMTAPPQYLEFILEDSEWEFYRQEWWRRVEQYYTKHH